jgi:hypothetical protein
METYAYNKCFFLKENLEYDKSFLKYKSKKLPICTNLSTQEKIDGQIKIIQNLNLNK